MERFFNCVCRRWSFRNWRQDASVTRRQDACATGHGRDACATTTTGSEFLQLGWDVAIVAPGQGVEAQIENAV